MSSQHQLVDQLIRAFKKNGITPELVAQKYAEWVAQNGGQSGDGITQAVQEALDTKMPRSGGEFRGKIYSTDNSGRLEDMGTNIPGANQIVEYVTRKISEAGGVSNQPVNSEPPYISAAGNIFVQGVTLTGNPGRWTGPTPAPSDPDSYVYSWYRNGTAIPNQTTTSYLVADADIGASIAFGVRPIKAGVTTTVTQSVAVTISGQKPVATVPPSVVGTMAVGVQLGITPGTYAPPSAKAATYVWQRDGVAITGATSSTYTIVQADVGKQIRVQETVGNAAGDTVAFSAARLVPQPTADFAGALIYAVNPADLFANSYTGAQPTAFQIETHGQVFPFVNTGYTNAAVPLLQIWQNQGVKYNSLDRITRGVDSVDGTTPVLKFNYTAADSAFPRMAITARRGMGGSGLPRGVKLFVALRLAIPAGFVDKPYFINLFNGDQDTLDTGGLSPWLTAYFNPSSTDLCLQVRHGTNGTDSFPNSAATVGATSTPQPLAKGAKHDIIIEMRLSNNDAEAPYLKAYLNGSSTPFFDYVGRVGFTLPGLLPYFSVGHMPYQTPLQNSLLEFGRIGIVADTANQYTRADARTWVLGGSVAAPATGQVPIANGYKIEVYGDSAAKSLRPTIGGYYSPNLASRIQTAMAGHGYTLTVVDEGRSATRLSQLIAGTDSNADPQAAHLPVAQQAAASTANIVTVNHGINDQAAAVSIAGSYKPDLTTFISTWRSAGKTVVLITPNPTQGGVNLAAYATAMREVGVATGTPVIDVHGYVSNLLGSNPVTTLMPDGVHPNEATYANIATFIAAQLNAMRVAPPPPSVDLFLEPYDANSPWKVTVQTLLGRGATYGGANHPNSVSIRNSSNFYCDGRRWTQRIYRASPGDPRVNFFVSAGVLGYAPARAGTVNVPLPAGAHPDIGRIGGTGTATDPWRNVGDGDSHFTVVEMDFAGGSYLAPEGHTVVVPAGPVAHEFWLARKNPDTGAYEAMSYTMVPLSGNGPQVGYGIGITGAWVNLPPPLGSGGTNTQSRLYRNYGWGSGRAYGGASMGGCIRAGETTRGIFHAIALLLDSQARLNPSAAPTYTPYPASKRDTADATGTIDHGCRLVVPQSVTAASLGISTPTGLILFNCARDYGFIVVDHAGGNKFNADAVAAAADGDACNAAAADLRRIQNALQPLIGGVPTP